MNFWTSFKVFVKGILMGVVNVVPVSSGTIALVLGVFERFINSIKSLNPKNFKYLFKGEVTEFGRRTDFRFLVTILLGIIVGMVFTAIFLKRVLKSYEVFVWAFFIGLIIASVINVMKSIEKVTVKNVIILVIGFVVSFFLSIHLNPESNDGFWYLFICGIVGATGMVVPGISGSHLMLLMGNYELIVTQAIPAMTKASTFMIGFRILLPFFLGSIVSIVSFSYLLSWLMKDFRNETLSALSGFMLGSLPVVYPWKEPSADMLDYVFHLPQINGEFFMAVLMAVVGAVAVYMLNVYARREEIRIQKAAVRRQKREERRKKAEDA
jgi:putative membrane protein